VTFPDSRPCKLEALHGSNIWSVHIAPKAALPRPESITEELALTLVPRHSSARQRLSEVPRDPKVRSTGSPIACQSLR
jgi:hypothetical protein